MPPGNIKDIYHQQGWNNDAAINADIAAGGWKSKVPQQQSSSSNNSLDPGSLSTQTNDLAAKQKAAMDEQFTQDKQDVNNFNTSYTNATNQTINDTSNKYHLPDLVNITNALDSRIKQLQGNTDNSGAEGMASAGQVDQALGSRYLPQFNQAVSNETNATQAAQAEANQRLAPYQTQAQMLNERLAREMTGFTQEQQNELQGLLSSMNAGVQLTTAQQQRANELAIAEEGYQNALNVAKTQNQNIILPNTSTYYNPSTGQAYSPFTTVASR